MKFVEASKIVILSPYDKANFDGWGMGKSPRGSLYNRCRLGPTRAFARGFEGENRGSSIVANSGGLPAARDPQGAAKEGNPAPAGKGLEP